MGEETLGFGAGGEVLFSYRQIVETSFQYGAASLVVVHNHPGVNPEPSQEDRNFTLELLFALHMVDIRLRDHLIIGDNQTFSFFEMGLIDRFNSDFKKRNLDLLKDFKNKGLYEISQSLAILCGRPIRTRFLLNRTVVFDTI